MFKYSINEPSVLGKPWIYLYKVDTPLTFYKRDFETAMLNFIKQPNINSTVILRADILINNEYDVKTGILNHSNKFIIPITDEDGIQSVNVNDLKPRSLIVDLSLEISKQIVRRIIPRNPYKDAIINQTCLILHSKTDPETCLIVYIPHFDNISDCPFYIPKVSAVGILFYNGELSVHYLPFRGSNPRIFYDESERVVRTGYRLLQTAYKHSMGINQGYVKRVSHDVVVNKIDFQNNYISLKKKYSKWLMDNWIESTDPKKHVFEDIAIAAFLIVLWKRVYGDDFKSKFEFKDLGCGNGVLCYILISEGFRGIGIDARKRKSWKLYPKEVQSSLKEQIIIPSILLKSHPKNKEHLSNIQYNNEIDVSQVGSLGSNIPVNIPYKIKDLLECPYVNLAEFSKETFIIGNHSDELTCWIPLLGYPFIVIPCCSYNLSGKKTRYLISDKSKSKNLGSTYFGLIDRVETISKDVGWKIEKEMLRIPSTRNAAIIGYKNSELSQFPTNKVYDIILGDGIPNDWIKNSMSLMEKDFVLH